MVFKLLFLTNLVMVIFLLIIKEKAFLVHQEETWFILIWISWVSLTLSSVINLLYDKMNEILKLNKEIKEMLKENK